MISILALVEDERAASCRFRLRQFVGPLTEEGIALRIEGLVRDRKRRRRLLRSAADYPVTILHRKLLRRNEYRALRRAAPRLIYDFDDAVMFRDSNATRQHSRRRMNRFRRLVQGSDLVLAGNDYLKARTEDAGGRALTFPTVVDIGDYPSRPIAKDASVIGWMGSASNFVYLTEIISPIQELMGSRSNLIFRVVADRPPDLGSLPVDYRPWSEEREGSDLAGFTVGVMPLVDDPWTRGKCAFKLLQYGAARLPSVASPVGANRVVIQNGVTGYLAKDAGEWRSRLGELLDSPGRREEMGRAARQLVEERYSLAAAVDGLAHLIRRMIGKEPGGLAPTGDEPRPAGCPDTSPPGPGGFRSGSDIPPFRSPSHPDTAEPREASQ